MASKFISINVKGAKQLADKMNALVEDLRKDVLTSAQKGATAIEREARVRAPRGATGQLEGSIKRRVVKSEGDVAVVAVVVGGSGVHGGRESSWLGIEFGNAHTPAQPFLRPALRDNREEIRKSVATVISQAIRRRFR